MQVEVFPSLRMRPEGISHTSLVLLESNKSIATQIPNDNGLASMHRSHTLVEHFFPLERSKQQIVKPVTTIMFSGRSLISINLEMF